MKNLIFVLSLTLIGSHNVLHAATLHCELPKNFSPQARNSLDQRITRFYVKKSERIMYAFSGDEILKTYHVSLGPNPIGPKQYEGDNKTPEGRYFLDYKVTASDYNKALHVSYPDMNDQTRSKPGGQIMLHGFPRPRSSFLSALLNLAKDVHWNEYADWTQGCIAVTDHEIEEIFANITQNYPNLLEWNVSSGELPIIDLCP